MFCSCNKNFTYTLDRMTRMNSFNNSLLSDISQHRINNLLKQTVVLVPLIDLELFIFE